MHSRTVVPQAVAPPPLLGTWLNDLGSDRLLAALSPCRRVALPALAVRPGRCYAGVPAPNAGVQRWSERSPTGADRLRPASRHSESWRALGARGPLEVCLERGDLAS